MSSLVDAAMPGMLPVINAECVRQAVRTGLGLKAQINLVLDVRSQELLLSGPAAGLPDQPVQVADRGRGRGHRRHARRREHHGGHRAAASGAGCRQVAARPAPDDVVRRSQPLRRRADGDRLQARHALLEQARAYVTKLRTILRYLGTCDGDMEKGSLRATSTCRCARPGEPLGTRCEIKNVNSIRFIGQAIDLNRRSIRTRRRWSCRRPEPEGDGASQGRVHSTARWKPSATRSTKKRTRSSPRRFRIVPNLHLAPGGSRWPWRDSDAAIERAPHTTWLAGLEAVRRDASLRLAPPCRRTGQELLKRVEAGEPSRSR